MSIDPAQLAIILADQDLKASAGDVVRKLESLIHSANSEIKRFKEVEENGMNAVVAIDGNTANLISGLERAMSHYHTACGAARIARSLNRKSN